MSKPAASSDPSILVLPVLSGYVEDFDALIVRLKDFVRFRETSFGPWLFDEAEQGCSVWKWVARHGHGDSCRDARILDEFVELVLAYDPFSRVVGVTAWVPSAQGAIRAESVLLNQLLSFVSVHLVQPRLNSFVQGPRVSGREPERSFEEDMAVREGSGAGLDLDFTAQTALLHAMTEGERRAMQQGPESGDGLVFYKKVDTVRSEFVADWLPVLLGDRADVDPQNRAVAPVSDRELNTRLDELRVEFFDADPHFSPVFDITSDALFARVVARTNEMRSLCGHMALQWPEIAPLRLGVPTAHITVCLATPDLARDAASVHCDACKGCDHKPDLLGASQLELDLAPDDGAREP